MAGEVIAEIKKKEDEASRIINDAHKKAGEIVEKARKAKIDFIQEKDRLLKKEEEDIKQHYEQEKNQVLQELEREEQKNIKQIKQVCEKNLGRAVDYIVKKIVEE
ncbi:MAG: hypothetical protein ACOC7U_02700 [Spirochaetota bacterium]